MKIISSENLNHELPRGTKGIVVKETLLGCIVRLTPQYIPHGYKVINSNGGIKVEIDTIGEKPSITLDGVKLIRVEVIPLDANSAEIAYAHVILILEEL